MKSFKFTYFNKRVNKLAKKSRRHPKILGASVQNSVGRETCHPAFAQPSVNDY